MRSHDRNCGLTTVASDAVAIVFVVSTASVLSVVPEDVSICLL